MIVEKNKVVSITYELWVDDGESGKVFFEKVDKDRPLEFIFGSGMLLEHFEKNIVGLKVGNSFDFSIEYQNAYGDYDETKVVFLPMSAFKNEGKVDKKLLRKGNVIPMKDNKGNVMRGEVLKVELSRVQLDFNHTLAGMDLFFKGEIVAIRDAAPEELSHGHVHGPEGHHH